MRKESYNSEKEKEKPMNTNSFKLLFQLINQKKNKLSLNNIDIDNLQ